MHNILCTFKKVTGWRIYSPSWIAGTANITVTTVNGVKYLKVPTTESHVRGRFCNPAKIAINYVRTEPVVVNATQVREGCIFNKITYIPIRECSICGFMLHYTIRDGVPFYNTSCDCTAYKSQPQMRSWEDLTYAVNSFATREEQAEFALGCGLDLTPTKRHTVKGGLLSPSARLARENAEKVRITNKAFGCSDGLTYGVYLDVSNYERPQLKVAIPLPDDFPPLTNRV